MAEYANMSPEELLLKAEEVAKREQRVRQLENAISIKNTETEKQNTELAERIAELEKQNAQMEEKLNTRTRENVRQTDAIGKLSAQLNIESERADNTLTRNEHLDRRIINLEDELTAAREEREQSRINRELLNLTNPFHNEEVQRIERVPLSIILKTALASVPTFNGQNVYEFIKACRRIKNQIPNFTHIEVIKLLENKLNDSAYVAVEGQHFNTIDEFLTRIKRVFSPNQTSNYFRGKLASLVKGYNEAMIEFVSRTAEIRLAIADCTCAELQLNNLTLAQEENLNKEIMDGFRQGLPPD